MQSKYRLAILGLWLCSGMANAETFTNPILPGGYPDPSICRDGENYYLVNSTFEYFPGLPIHQSSDLVNWTLVGHGLHRPGQVSGAVNFLDVQSDGGIHAPSIRCHAGKFYLITTHVYLGPGEGAETEFVNFVLTADNPAGPWSDPLVLDGAPGIDPDIIFDDDGKVWYVGTHSPDKPNFPGEGEIWLQEIDTERWALTGDRHFLWRGACGGVWAEGPHIYKQDGRYYLMVAEGGTSFNHAVSIAVSDKITGPYQSNPRNPVFSSRHLSYDHWVNSTGHADLFQTTAGDWYAVMLGIRGDTGRRSNMGRETHLVPVTWEREPFEWQAIKYLWPVFAPENGRLLRQIPVPLAGTRQMQPAAFHDDFDSTVLDLQWNFRRLPLPGIFSLEDRPGWLRLRAHPNRLAERKRAAWMGIRQTESYFDYRTHMAFGPESGHAQAGIALVQKDDYWLSMLVTRQQGNWVLILDRQLPGDLPERLHVQPLPGYNGEIQLGLRSSDDRYKVWYQLPLQQSPTQVITLDGTLFPSRGYTGAYLGLYVIGDGNRTKDHADFDWVFYEGHAR